jgi:hypothetical protein
MKLSKLCLPSAVLVIGSMFLVSVSHATPEMQKKEKKPCTTCHIANGKKELNNVGKYYQEKKTLEGAPAQKK